MRGEAAAAADMPWALVVTAVAAEAEAVSAGLADAGVADRVRVIAGGVGPSAAAAATATALTSAAAAGRGFPLVLSAGIGGGFAPRAPVGGTVVASLIAAADLGVRTADGFLDVAELGFGTAVHIPPAGLARRVAEAAEPGGALLAPVLTVSSATGTGERAAELTARYPDAGAEAMEGFGVAEAAARAGVPVLEIRTVSSPVGPRDRDAWRIPAALRKLTGVFSAAGPLLNPSRTGVPRD